MKNVLLVDDDNIFQFLGTRMLCKAGIEKEEIHTALNGQQALDLFNHYYSGIQALPEIILLDLNMPVMDGFGFLEAFQRLELPNKDKVKIIIVTSSENPADIELALKLGATKYLKKPLEEATLRIALQDI